MRNLERHAENGLRLSASRSPPGARSHTGQLEDGALVSRRQLRRRDLRGPHAPPCNSTYPCRSEPYEPPSPCFKLEGDHPVCGVVAQPTTYAYPGGLPRPLAQGTRIVGRFTVTF